MVFPILRTKLPLAPLASVLCLLVGCGGSKKLDTDATLKSLTLSNGVLQGAPATAPMAVTLYASDQAFTVTPVAESKVATVLVNNVQVPSGTASPVLPIAAGTTPVSIEVKAQEWDITQMYDLNVTKYPTTTTVSVYDAPGGMPVPAAQLTLNDAAGNLLEGGIPVDATGYNTFGLPAGKFALLATAPGHAQSAYLGLDPAFDATVNMVCPNLGMINFPAVAPVLDVIAYSADGSTWKGVQGGVISDLAANIRFLQVNALGRSGITPAAWGGFGIGLAVDQQPINSPDTGNYTYDSGTMATMASPVPMEDGTTWYLSTSYFNIPITSLTAGSTHVLDLVVYDVANNRTEQKLHVTVQDQAAIATDPDLSALAPASPFVYADTYGVETGAFGVAPVGSPTSSYEVAITFQMPINPATSQPFGIRGYEVYRSTDQAAWKKIATSQMGGLDTSGSYYFVDEDPALVTGRTYYYKVRAFTGNTATAGGGYSSYSAVVGTSLLPPWQMTLTSPADGAVSATLTPTLAFQASNGTLWNGSLVDRFYFYTHVQDKNGTDLFDAPFRYNFVNQTLEAPDGSSPTGWSSAAGQGWTLTTNPTSTGVGLTFQVPGGYLFPGDTVEWTVYGRYSNGFVAPYFVKTQYAADNVTPIGQATSWGSDFNHKYDALNGMFTLILSPTAN